MHEPDITMEGVLPQVQHAYTSGPCLMGGYLRHQRYPHTIFNQLDDGFQFIQLANLTQGEMHLPKEAIHLSAPE